MFTQKKVLLNQQKFGWLNRVFRLNMGQMKILFELTKKILLIFFFVIPTKKVLYRQQKNGFAN